MPSRIVFEDEEIRVVHRPGATGYSLVTFAAMGHWPDRTYIISRRARAVRVFDGTAMGGQGRDAGGRVPAKAAICFRRAVDARPGFAEVHLGRSPSDVAAVLPMGDVRA